VVWRALNGLRLGAEADLEARIQIDGDLHTAKLSERSSDHLVLPMGRDVLLVENGWAYAVSAPRHISEEAAAAGNGTITAPMPGRVVSIDVAEGDAVTKGQKLVTLEAMKMEHALDAPFDGTVAELGVTANAQLVEGALILRIDKIDDE